jgi:hypothetical protein
MTGPSHASGFSMISWATAKMLLPFSTTSSRNSVIPPGFLHLNNLPSSFRPKSRRSKLRRTSPELESMAAQCHPRRPRDHRQASGDVGMITVVKALLPKCREAHMPIYVTLERSTNRYPRRLNCGAPDTMSVMRTLHEQCHSILCFIAERQLA